MLKMKEMSYCLSLPQSLSLPENSIVQRRFTDALCTKKKMKITMKQSLYEKGYNLLFGLNLKRTSQSMYLEQSIFIKDFPTFFKICNFFITIYIEKQDATTVSLSIITFHTNMVDYKLVSLLLTNCFTNCFTVYKLLPNWFHINLAATIFRRTINKKTMN